MKAPRLFLLLLAFVPLVGCIRSRAIVTSEPSEAMVWWNNDYRGRTPIEIPFIWNWKYQVEVEKEGYKRQKSIEFFRTRPWFIEPFGLICEALPLRFTDTRHVHYVLEEKEESL